MLNQRSSNGLSWLLTEAILYRINHAGGPVAERIDLTLLIADTVGAMVSDNLADKAIIDSEVKALEELWRNYTPVLDENRIVVTDTKTDFNIYLSKIMRNLLIVIYTNDLINPSMLKEIKAAKW